MHTCCHFLCTHSCQNLSVVFTDYICIMNDDINQKFLENPFTENLLETYSAILKIGDKRVGFVFGENNHRLLNENEKCISRIFALHSNLTHSVEHIHFIKTFLKRYPYRKFYTENNITQLSYIQYHTEVLFHKVHTILDIMKQLVNEVYKLKITSKDCSWNLLSAKLNIKNPSMQVIERYYKTFENIIKIRNENTHRGNYNDSGKDEIEMEYGQSVYELHDRLGIETNIEFIKTFPKFMINYKLKEYRKKRIQLVNEIQENVYKLGFEFLSSLNKKFEEENCASLLPKVVYS